MLNITNSRSTTKELTFSSDGTPKVLQTAMEFLKKQFTGVITSRRKGNLVTFVLPNEVPETTVWIDGVNAEFWKQNPDLNPDKSAAPAGFGY